MSLSVGKKSPSPRIHHVVIDVPDEKWAEFEAFMSEIGKKGISDYREIPHTPTNKGYLNLALHTYKKRQPAFLSAIRHRKKLIQHDEQPTQGHRLPAQQRCGGIG